MLYLHESQSENNGRKEVQWQISEFQSLTSSLVIFNFDILAGIQSLPYDFHHQWFVQINKLTGHDDFIKIFFFNDEAKTVFFDQF